MREEHIKSVVKERYDYLVAHGYNVFGVFLQGSQNYELDIYTDEYKSDIDVKAIVIPSLNEIVLNNKPVSTTIVLENNEHIEAKDIRVMKEMFIKQNISYIELLYTKYYYINPEYNDEFKILNDMKDDISSINQNQFLRCIAGMSMEKHKALEHPYPTIIDKINKYGYDPKQLHHILRLNVFVNDYLANVPLKECYVPAKEVRDILLDVKLGVYPLEMARNMAKVYDDKTHEICRTSQTQFEFINHNSINKLNDWVCQVIKKSLLNELKNR